MSKVPGSLSMASAMIRVIFAIAYGITAIYTVICLGLFRLSPLSPIVTGTRLAASSGLLWYFAAVSPLIWPKANKGDWLAALFNVGAAVSAAGSAAFLVPNDQLTLIKTTFGLMNF